MKEPAVGWPTLKFSERGSELAGGTLIRLGV